MTESVICNPRVYKYIYVRTLRQYSERGLKTTYFLPPLVSPRCFDHTAVPLYAVPCSKAAPCPGLSAEDFWPAISKFSNRRSVVLESSFETPNRKRGSHTDNHPTLACIRHVRKGRNGSSPTPGRLNLLAAPAISFRIRLLCPTPGPSKASNAAYLIPPHRLAEPLGNFSA